MKKNIGYCGLDCEKCDAFLATVRNDDALRAKTAALWSRLNGVEILPEMIHCQGCRAEGAKTYFAKTSVPSGNAPMQRTLIPAPTAPR